MSEKEMYWGFHLMLDVAGPDLAKIKDKKNIEKFAATLVKRIDMVAFGKPVAVRFGTGDKQGFTLYQLIETSNISVHYVENNGADGTELYLDVFSCKPFEAKDVIDTVREFFGLTSYNETFIKRVAPRG